MRLRESGNRASNEAKSNSNEAENSAPELKTGWVGAGVAETFRPSFAHVRQNFDWSAAHAYLFDIDGTLLNSRDAVHYHAFHRAVAQVFGLNFHFDGVPVHGNTDVGILRAYLENAGVPEHDWGPRLPEVLELMSAEVERNSAELRPEICPSVVELIQQLSARDMALLGFGSAFYMLALTLGQALIALEHHGRYAFGWVVGVVAFLVAVLVGGSDVLLRGELAYFVGSIAALIAMMALLWRPLRETTGREAESLLDAVRAEPMEP